VPIFAEEYAAQGAYQSNLSGTLAFGRDDAGFGMCDFEHVTLFMDGFSMLVYFAMF
jgi:hypothetical protein